MIGGLIMTHSDDDGLVLPPKIAPIHITILPIYRKENEYAAIKDYVSQLKKQISNLRYNHELIRVEIDERELHGGEKFWHSIKRGIPIVIEVGSRDVSANQIYFTRRDQVGKKIALPMNQFLESLPQILQEMQTNLFKQAVTFQQQHTHFFDDLNQFKEFFAPEKEGGFALVYSSDDPSIEPLLNDFKISARCIPLASMQDRGNCIFTGKPGAKKIIYARAY